MPSTRCGYFSLPSMSSTLWLLITCLSKLLPPETHFSPLYLCRSVSTYRQLQGGVRYGRSSSKFLPVAQHANPPLFFAAQALYCSFIDWEVLCCSGINSWGDPSLTISLSVRPLWLEGGRQCKSQNTRGHRHGEAGNSGSCRLLRTTCCKRQHVLSVLTFLLLWFNHCPLPLVSP